MEARRAAEEMERGIAEQQRMQRGNDGPPSARGSRRKGASRGEPLNVYLAPLKSIVRGIDLFPVLTTELEVQVQSGPLLEREASESFQAGYQSLANELMYAHFVTEYEDAQGAILSAQYSSLFKRPLWSIRCGLSMAVRGGDSLTDFQPITESTRRARRSSGGGAPDPREMMMERSGPPDDYDPSRAEDEARAAAMGSGRGLSNRTPKASTAPMGLARPAMISTEAQEELQRHIGLVATVLSEEFDKRWQTRHFGSLFASVTAPIAQPTKRGQRRGRSATTTPSAQVIGPLADLLSEAPQPIPMFRPGLIFLGQGGSEEMLEVAVDQDLDLLFHIDVTIKESKGSTTRNQTRKTTTVQNVARIRVYNVHQKKSLVGSRAIDNKDLEKTSKLPGDGSNRDYVREQMLAMWSQIDAKVKAEKLPKLTPEVAQRRITSLFAGNQDKPLRKMAEVRLYQALELVKPEDVENAFTILGGYDGLVLLHGPLAERREIARKLAIEAIDVLEE